MLHTAETSQAIPFCTKALLSEISLLHHLLLAGGLDAHRLDFYASTMAVVKFACCRSTRRQQLDNDSDLS